MMDRRDLIREGLEYFDDNGVIDLGALTAYVDARAKETQEPTRSGDWLYIWTADSIFRIGPSGAEKVGA